MQMERERMNLSNGEYGQFYWGFDEDFVDRELRNREHSPGISSSSSSSKILPVSSSPMTSSFCGVNYIEHPVSKLDTLAGVAIKYGVEVADIKKMNGLVTDLQMFALKSLHIPLPGRHPPSPCLSDGPNCTGSASSHESPTHRAHHELFDSFQSLKLKSPQKKMSPAMTYLQGYYRLKASEGCEMAVYKKGGSHYLEDRPSLKTYKSPFSHHRKSRSFVNGFFDENGELSDIISVTESRDGDSSKWNDKLLRRRQKSEADFTSRTPELLMKDDNSMSSGFSPIKGKGLALRQKAANRNAITSDADAVGLNPVPIALGDSFLADGLSGVRKSSSTSNLQDQESGNSSVAWPTSRWGLKPDLQARSTAAISKPIFDGLPKPVTSRRNKAAMD